MPVTGNYPLLKVQNGNAYVPVLIISCKKVMSTIRELLIKINFKFIARFWHYVRHIYPKLILDNYIYL